MRRAGSRARPRERDHACEAVSASCLAETRLRGWLNDKRKHAKSVRPEPLSKQRSFTDESRCLPLNEAEPGQAQIGEETRPPSSLVQTQP
eukprot:2543521-Pleurochrysis_carterae.AAC.1